MENMEDCRRTRSQGPPSLPEGTELNTVGFTTGPSKNRKKKFGGM